MSRGMKKEGEAVGTYGRVIYDAVPKSAFALLAWHFAMRIAEDDEGGALKEICSEMAILRGNGIIPDSQLKRLLSALVKVRDRA